MSKLQQGLVQKKGNYKRLISGTVNNIINKAVCLQNYK